MTLLGVWHELLPSYARCRQVIATAAVLVVVLADHYAQAEQRGNCAPHQIAVVYAHPSELDAACNAVGDIARYFAGIGFQISTRAAIHFANQSKDSSKGHSPAHGLFDPLRSQIIIYRTSDTKPWGQAWSPKLVGSFLRHEIVHSVIWDVMRGDAKRLRPEWHEFIAYAIQLELMDPDLRKEVLAAHAEVSAVKDLTEINEFSYGMHPQLFAVVAYKTYLERGEGTFVRQLLKSEIKPAPFSYPFAVQPHEVRP